MRNSARLHFGAQGATVFVRRFLRAGGSESPVFLVAGRGSYEASGAARFFEPLFSGLKVVRFSDFSASPKIEDLRRGLEAFRGAEAGRIIAVGGGSALDLGKLVNYFSATRTDPGKYPGARGIKKPVFLPLLAVPTTAGTGSEATAFAVLYRGLRKLSVADARLLPSAVLLNPAFTASLPPYQAACSGFDALAQAIESYWAVGSTPASLRDSARALRLCQAHLEEAVLAPTAAHRAGMLEAAHFSGRAINAAKTTAAHALSYALTVHYGLPHGHAVALTLPALFEANAAVTGREVNDPRGAQHVRASLRELCRLLGAGSPREAAEKLRALMVRIGLSAAWLRERGFDPVRARALVMREADPARLGNNPRRLDAAALGRVLAGIG